MVDKLYGSYTHWQFHLISHNKIGLGCHCYDLFRWQQYFSSLWTLAMCDSSTTRQWIPREVLHRTTRTMTGNWFPSSESDGMHHQHLLLQQPTPRRLRLHLLWWSWWSSWQYLHRCASDAPISLNRAKLMLMFAKRLSGKQSWALAIPTIPQAWLWLPKGWNWVQPTQTLL